MAAITPHSAERNILAGCVGGALLGQTILNADGTAIFINGDLASNATTAKANVDSDVAKLHVAEKTFGVRVKAAIDQMEYFNPGSTSGSSIAAITNMLPASARGRSLAL